MPDVFEKPPFVFSGIFPYIERAASRLGCDMHQFGRTRSLWHVSQIQTALGQVPTMERSAQLERMAHVHQDRMGLAAALAGMDDAIREVMTELDLPLPPYHEEPPSLKPSRNKEK
jgi:hypothetical protein